MPTEIYQIYVDIRNLGCIIENVSFNNMHIFIVIQNLHFQKKMYEERLR